MTKRITLVLLAVMLSAQAWADPVVYPTNKDGSTITSVLTAGFDPIRVASDKWVYKKILQLIDEFIKLEEK